MPELNTHQRSIGARHLPGSIVLAACVLSACTTGSAPPEDGSFPRDRAAVARDVQPVEESVPPQVRAAGRDGGTVAAPAPVPTGGLRPADEPGPYVAVLDLPDDADDNGLRAPGYADVVRLRISSNGPNARVTVRVGHALPERLAEGEVMGIGVDLYRPGASESDYQLFAEGSDDGWFAWRSTPTGLGEYAGTFEAGGRAVVFEVPWTALGDLRSPEVRAFLDWSAPGVALNQSGSDAAPNRGRAAFQR